MKGQISLAVKGLGLLHEPFSRSDLLRVLERERVRETPTGPDSSPSGWPLCKRALNRPCERLFNWAAWKWQSALPLWVDLYPVTKSRRGTSCIWTLILLGRWEKYLYKYLYISNYFFAWCFYNLYEWQLISNCGMWIVAQCCGNLQNYRIQEFYFSVIYLFKLPI